MSVLTLVHAGDWTGLYLDDLLVGEEQDMDAATAAGYGARLQPDHVAVAFADPDWFEHQRGLLPARLSEVVTQDGPDLFGS